MSTTGISTLFANGPAASLRGLIGPRQLHRVSAFLESFASPRSLRLPPLLFRRALLNDRAAPGGYPQVLHDAALSRARRIKRIDPNDPPRRASCSATSVQLLADRFDDAIQIFIDLMFPDADDVPSGILELQRLAAITGNIGRQLVRPELDVGSWSNVMGGAPVPLAAVDEQCNPLPDEGQVSPADWRRRLRSTTYPGRGEGFPKDEFGGSVSPPNSSHQFRAARDSSTGHVRSLSRHFREVLPLPTSSQSVATEHRDRNAASWSTSAWNLRPVLKIPTPFESLAEGLRANASQPREALEQPRRRPSRGLVGPRRFELPTSCTPSKRASQAALRPDRWTETRGRYELRRAKPLAARRVGAS